MGKNIMSTPRNARFCRPCDRHVVARRPSILWNAALAAVALLMVVAVLASSLIGPFIMFAIPLMAIFGFALGPLVMLTSTPATCPHCHREVPHRHRADVTSAVSSGPQAVRRAAIGA